MPPVPPDIARCGFDGEVVPPVLLLLLFRNGDPPALAPRRRVSGVRATTSPSAPSPRTSCMSLITSARGMFAHGTCPILRMTSPTSNPLPLPSDGPPLSTEWTYVGPLPLMANPNPYSGCLRMMILWPVIGSPYGRNQRRGAAKKAKEKKKRVVDKCQMATTMLFEIRLLKKRHSFNPQKKKTQTRHPKQMPPPITTHTYKPLCDSYPGRFLASGSFHVQPPLQTAVLLS